MRWWESTVRFLSARFCRVFKLRGVLELEQHSLPLWLLAVCLRIIKGRTSRPRRSEMMNPPRQVAVIEAQV